MEVDTEHHDKKTSTIDEDMFATPNKDGGAVSASTTTSIDLPTRETIPTLPLTSTKDDASTRMSWSPKSPSRLSPRSLASFRVLTECPLIVMLMFQLYPKFLRGNIPTLIQVMMDALNLRAPSIGAIERRQQQQQQLQQQQRQTQQSNAPVGTLNQSTSGTPSLQNETPPKLDAAARRLYYSRSRELAAAHSKTLSFLTYLLRGFSHELKPYEDRLASNVVAIMSSCPREFISTRKELLVATRHFLNSDFRSGFFRHVDALLDEKVLMGPHNHSYSEQSILRPLGYAVLSDLVTHVRGILTLPQLSKIVLVFSRVLHDATVPPSTQYTAVKTLLSVVDSVFQSKDRDIQMARDILVRVLRTFVEKLSSLQLNTSDQGEFGRSCDVVSFGHEEHSSTDATSSDGNEDPVKGRKNIIRAIVVGSKSLIWYINNFSMPKEKERPETPQAHLVANEEVYSGLSKITHTERSLIDQYIVFALPSILSLKRSSSGDEEVSDMETGEHYRDTLTHFAAGFTSLDSYDLRRILGPRLHMFVEAVKDDPTTIVVPRHLLSANAATSFEFCTIMLNFLVDRMDKLVLSTEEGIQFLPVTSDDEASSPAQIKRLTDLEMIDEIQPKDTMQSISNAYLQLYERILKSLSSYPENERALRPHLKTIVATCLRCSLEKTCFKADNYCMLLRYVFRSISAGKFEESYRELLPLIPIVLNGLYRILSSSQLVSLRHTLVELVLTIPARLSSLLPHLNLLLRVIVLSLESTSDDLVNLGLRTLEFWIDNLNPEFLFPEMSKELDVYGSVMKALSNHLRPAPYPYGLLTLRLLGKLGGKNRRVLREPINFNDPVTTLDHRRGCLAINGVWKREKLMSGEVGVPMCVSLPLNECVDLLKRASFVQSTLFPDGTSSGTDVKLSWHKLMSCDINLLDMESLCIGTVGDTLASQVEAALHILHTSLAKVTKISSGKVTLTAFDGNGLQQTVTSDNNSDMQSVSAQKAIYDHQFETIVLGLLYGCSCRREEVSFVKKLLAGVYDIVVSNQERILRVDANGTPIDTSQIGEEVNLGSFRPFGYFDLNGPFDSTVDPLVVNKAIAQFLCQPSVASASLGLEIVAFVLGLPEQECQSTGGYVVEGNGEKERGTRIYFEHLLSSLCEQCIQTEWSLRDGLHSSLCLMLETLGSSWGKIYENEIMNVALFSIKSVPRELSVAGMKSFRFLMNLCACLYGPPRFMQVQSTVHPFVFDLLSPWKNKGMSEDPPSEHRSIDIHPLSCPNDDVLQILVTEMASTKQLAR
jgi:hypothetical protein